MRGLLLLAAEAPNPPFGRFATAALTNLLWVVAGALPPILIWLERKVRLGRKNRQARIDAAVAKGSRGVAELAQLAVNDRSAYLRIVVLKQLQTYGPRAAAAVPSLVKLLDELTRTRMWGAETALPQLLAVLQSIGPPAAPAVPGLVRLLAWRLFASKSTVMATIERIGPAALPYLDQSLREPKTAEAARRAIERVRHHAPRAAADVAADPAPPSHPSTSRTNSYPPAFCINCIELMPAGAVICVACGTDQRTGRKLKIAQADEASSDRKSQQPHPRPGA